LGGDEVLAAFESFVDEKQRAFGEFCVSALVINAAGDVGQADGAEVSRWGVEERLDFFRGHGANFCSTDE